jgi:putative radical SAM enzyme (TIGR03279 family)
MKRIYIKDILPDSIAEEMEIEAGDYLLSINDTEIKDILDYKYQIFDEYIVVTIEKADGEIWDLEIEKEENEDLGLVFEEQLIDKPRSCANKCIFCFMDQLPPKVRETLIFKDDDFRLSFMTGNYVTFTNSSFRDLDRIIKYHLSPINISVHATDPEVRKMMLNNKNAGMILDYIKYLTDNGIQVNAQIVLCPDINDGEILDKTISELSAFYPNLLSIAIVPVGLTKHREGLFELKGFTPEGASKLIDQVESWQTKFYEKYEDNLVFCADEFYVKADREIPDCTRYGNFEQLEDGIGLMSYFTMDFNKTLMKYKTKKLEKTVSVATGKSAYKFIREKADILEQTFEGLKINVYAIENLFFGPEITVTGLITGGDLIEGLKDKELGEYLVIDKKMLKDDEDIFLDNLSLAELKTTLNINIVKSDSFGEGFIKSIIGEK